MARGATSLFLLLTRVYEPLGVTGTHLLPLHVTVALRPPGIDEGEAILIKDKGHSLNANVKGDIKIQIKINNNTEFKRSGLDLILEKTISLKEALCGFTFEIKYINGKSYTLNNNKGNIIPPNYKKVYPEMGLVRDNCKGNMVIHFNVQFPEKLTEIGRAHV